MKAGRTARTHRRPPCPGMKTVELNETPAGEHHGHERTRERIHVSDRQRRNQPLLPRTKSAVASQTGVEGADLVKIILSENAAFRSSGGARCVEHRHFPVCGGSASAGLRIRRTV